MHNLMQDWPLRVNSILDHAARYHANRPIISRSIEGPITKTNWSGIRQQALRCTQALRRLGVKPGDVVGVMAWNTARHLQVWYGVPGAGAVLHTLNPRLSPDQMSYVINHASDSVLMLDADLLPIIEAIYPRLNNIRKIIVMSDRAHMPETTLDVLCYEDLLTAEDGDTQWHQGDERDACGICYTSGTTGNPKGVVYTHRSNVLHALSLLGPDMLGFGAADTVMPVVPLFHANGWSIGYSAPISGCAMVLPGKDMSPPAIYEMLQSGVTITAAVPTVWLGLLNYLRTNPDLKFSTLSKVIIGGSSCPRAVIETFQNTYNVQVLHAWGMTELSPVGTICSFKPEIAALDDAGRLDAQETVGHPPYTIELKITAQDGTRQPEDGIAQGTLWARGPAVVGTYLHADKPAADPDGWFDTGDVATIDPNGYVRITDRSKDVIKSGGEWISSIDLENAAVAHPDVAEAAAIGIAHPKWDERPILVIVRQPGTDPDKQAILDLVAQRFAKWQVPDDVLFVTELPHTATGKISKLSLRAQLNAQGYSLPT